MDDTRLTEVRAFLEGERARLLAEIAEYDQQQENLSDASGENNYRDQIADLGSATFAREIDMSLEDNVKDVLTAVDRAIARIDDGSYGKCRRCGTTIPDDRLEAMATAELCIACKEWEEGR
jgi:DnaK suppressor protein